jgi:isocitrate dehydrogenase
MKATMMKVSDPIIFGHAVRVYLRRSCLRQARRHVQAEIGVDVNNGFGDLVAKVR